MAVWCCKQLATSKAQLPQIHKQDFCGHTDLKGVDQAAPISGVFHKPCSKVSSLLQKVCVLGARGDPPKSPTRRSTQMKEVPLWTLSGNPDNLLIFFLFCLFQATWAVSSKWKWVFYWAAVERRNIVGEKTIIKRRHSFMAEKLNPEFRKWTPSLEMYRIENLKWLGYK